MYCKNCGQKINDDADFCVHCGRSTDKQNVQKSYEVDKPKTSIGIFLGLFLGFIGLIIGLLLYPSGTDERSTFLEGWLGAFIASIIVAIMGGLLSRFAPYRLWQQYRITAETLVAEFWSYKSHVGDYKSAVDADELFAERVQ